MCGIVLAGGNMTSTDLDIFNQLLYCDVFRGQHSTGVFGQRKSSTEVFSYKEALPSFAFILKDEYQKVSAGATKYAVAPSWIVGHNRHATRGAVNARNAHPFTHGNITLVHNGTLTDQDLLPDSKQFEVDSENICHSINLIGGAATIQKLDGAFTLIWHDAKDNTLHIIRNSERPFHLARCGLDWFGASEEDMLMWILNRSRSHKNRINEHFECKVGTEYIFDVSGNKMTLAEEVAHTLPVFTAAARWNNWGYSSWGQDYNQDPNKDERFARHSAGNNANSQSGASAASDVRRKDALNKQNQIAIDKGLKLRRDQLIDITPHQFEEYKNAVQEGRGKMTGFFYDNEAQEYIEADIHNVKRSDYDQAMDSVKTVYRGTIGCINEVNSLVRLVLVSGRFIWDGVDSEPESTTAHEFNDDIPFDMDDSFISKNTGVKITRKFWEAHAHGECGGCGEHIDWQDAPKAVFAYSAYWHPKCFEGIQKAETTPEEDVEMGICAVCGNVKLDAEFDDDMSEARKEDICKVCATEIRARAASRTIEEGYIWTKCVDTTGPRRTEQALRVDARMLSRMIVLKDSVKKAADLTLHDVPFCYIEKRAGGIYAITMKQSRPDEPVAKEETTSQEETFRRKPESSLSLRKIVTSIDGKTEVEFTKALWANLGYCKFCYKQIAWRDAETCTLGGLNSIVCSSNICRGKM